MVECLFENIVCLVESCFVREYIDYSEEGEEKFFVMMFEVFLLSFVVFD